MIELHIYIHINNFFKHYKKDENSHITKFYGIFKLSEAMIMDFSTIIKIVLFILFVTTCIFGFASFFLRKWK